MATSNITRTIFTAKAYGFKVNGLENGVPMVERTPDVEFVSTAPNKTEAFRALKAAGIKCSKDMVAFDVVGEQVYALSLEQFMQYAVPVERRRNGELKAVTKDEQAMTD